MLSHKHFIQTSLSRLCPHLGDIAHTRRHFVTSTCPGPHAALVSVDTLCPLCPSARTGSSARWLLILGCSICHAAAPPSLVFHVECGLHSSRFINFLIIHWRGVILFCRSNLWKWDSGRWDSKILLIITLSFVLIHEVVYQESRWLSGTHLPVQPKHMLTCVGPMGENLWIPTQSCSPHPGLQIISFLQLRQIELSEQ